MYNLRKSAAAVIPNGKKILAVSRKHDHNDFALPGGKVDPGETFEECIVREVKEETGLVVFAAKFLYQRIEGEFQARTYLCLPVIGSSMEIKTEEKGVVKWTDWDEIFKGSFGSYNKDLYDHLVKENFFATEWMQH